MRNKNIRIKTSRSKHMRTKNFRSVSGGASTSKIKWWHILLIVLGVVIIAAGITAAVLFKRAKDTVSNIENNDKPPVISGEVVSTGKYIPNDSEELILCVYTEAFSGETVVLLQKAEDVKYEYGAYYVFVSEDGSLNYDFSGEHTGEYSPEQMKNDLFSLLKSLLGYTDERLANCGMVIYEPVSFTKVSVSEVELTEDGKATIKYRACALDGELSEEYTLSGTYTQTENEFIFTYEEMPEDEALLCVAQNLLSKAEFDGYVMYGEWQNTLTFGETLKLTIKPEQESTTEQSEESATETAN